MTTATQYQKQKQNPDFVEKERKRINELVKKRYATDPEYRNKVIENAKARREKIKLEKDNINH